MCDYIHITMLPYSELTRLDSYLQVSHENHEEYLVVNHTLKQFWRKEIGEPKQWMYFDESDPYYIPYDIFDDVERVEAIVEKLIELDHRQ